MATKKEKAVDDGLTPFKRQYNEVKSRYNDCILFFRLGDFYEMFDEDAITASQQLDLTLTTRDRNKPAGEQTPMCGVPYQSADMYITELLRAGFKVAVCEQLEDPAKAKGLVKRDVIRVITPGTVTSESMLEKGRGNYLAAVYLDRSHGAAAICDVSTGEFFSVSYADNALLHLTNELGGFAPREAVLSKRAMGNKKLVEFLHLHLSCALEPDGERFSPDGAEELVCRQFSANSAGELGLTSDAALLSCAALLRYIEETQKCDISHINRVEIIQNNQFMELDWAARNSLELTKNQRTGDKRGSLLWVLDHTCTPMGSRMLRSWIEMPLLSIPAIRRRLSAVKELVDEGVVRQELRQAMTGMSDLARLVSRAVYQAANGRDLISLAQGCERLPEIKRLLSNCKSAMLSDCAAMEDLAELHKLIDDAIAPEPPFSIRDGGVLKPGYSEEVERLRTIRENAVYFIAEIERREQERTGIKKLKVGYNKVFGYYIEVPSSVKIEQLPSDYVRKQTLTNRERYINTELKTVESEITGARERICSLEYEIFCQIRAEVASWVTRVQAVAEKLATLDALCSFAEAASRNGYVCPEVDESGAIDIHDGRHPMVELTQKETRFVPNDTFLNLTTDRLSLITGPNMAGKSTYMRQTALIVLMAQMGSFVPARSANIGIVDRVFTRIGASDDLTSGRSTFMVEMTEVADILKSATRHSLIILDEIGRGTSTYDGMAIARAVLEYCADKKKLGAKTMLATHYHELTELEGSIDGMKNYSITARKQDGGVIFLRRIVRGAADDSYGIEVAALAGVPDELVERAKECLRELNASACRPAAPVVEEPAQLTFGQSSEEEVLDALRAAQLDVISPIEAMNLLYELKRKLAP